MRLDDVRGIVIGEVTKEIYVTFHDPQTGEIRIGGAWHKDEESAIEYAREGWPTLFAKGLEMRIYD